VGSDHWCRPAQGSHHSRGDRWQRGRGGPQEGPCRVTQVDQLVVVGPNRSGRARGRSESAAGWAICCRSRLVAAGETVVDVPATSGVRGSGSLATGRSNKNDPTTLCRLLSPRCVSAGCIRWPGRPWRGCCGCWPAKHRYRVTNGRGWCAGCTPWSPELVPGGIAKEINASDVERLLETLHPATPVERVRYDLAVELLGRYSPARPPAQGSHRGSADAVRASATSLTELFGVRPDHRRGCSSDTPAISGRFAAGTATPPTTATAPVEFSSGGRVVHRLVRAREPTAQPRPSTWPLSASSANPTPTAGLLRTAGQRGQDQPGKPSEPSSARSANAVYRRLVPTLAAPRCSGPGRTDGEATL